MAHLIQVPFSVEFAPKPRKWEVCKVELAEMPSGAVQPGTLMPLLSIASAPAAPLQGIALYRVTSPSLMERAVPSHFMVGGFPVGEARLLDTLRNLSSIPGKAILDIVVSFPREAKPSRLQNPWTMRDEFLQLRQTTNELSKFLNRWGSWGGSALYEYPSVHRGLGAEMVEFVIPQDVWGLQASYKAGLAGDAAMWLSENGRMPTPTRRATPPFLAVRDERCIAAIETTITMDKLADVPYRLCARSDCGEVFKVESNHSRAYCSQSCAHLVSVRRGREAKRQAKANAAKEKK